MKRPVACLVAFASFAAADVCHADTQADAAARYQEGRARFAHYDFAGARDSLLQAYKLDPQPKYLWDLALAEYKAERLLEAQRHFRTYLRGSGGAIPATTDAQRKSIEKILAEVQGKTSHVTIVAPAGAVVRIDGGAATDLGPESVADLMPGKHLFEAQVGGQFASSTVEPKAGETLTVELRIEAPAAPVMPSPSVPAPPVPVAPPPLTPPPRLHGAGPARWIVSLGAGGAGLVSLAVGTMYFVKGGSDNNAASSLRGQAGNCTGSNSSLCSSLHDANVTAAQDQNVAVTLTAVGASLLVAGAVSWFVWPSPPAASPGAATAHLSLDPLVSPSSLGASLTGRF
jgi:hypothetical protein